MSFPDSPTHPSLNGKQPESDLPISKLPISELPTLLMPESDPTDQKTLLLEAPASEPRAQIAWPRNGQTKGRGLWKRLSLRTKVTAAAMLVGVLPVLVTGAAAYTFAGQAVSQQIQDGKQARVNALARRLAMFMRERLRDTQSLAATAVFANPKLAGLATPEQKEQILNDTLQIYGKTFSNIAVFDLNGTRIAQTPGAPVGNIETKAYFKQVVKTGSPVIVNPEMLAGTGAIVAVIAVPIKSTVTGQTMGVVRSQVPLTSLYTSVEDLATFGDQIHAIDSNGNFVFVSKQDMSLFGKSVDSEFPGFSKRIVGKKADSQFNLDGQNNLRLVAYKIQDKVPGMPDLNWVGITTLDGDIALKPQHDLLIAVSLGTLITALLVGALAAYLANQATQPIVKAAKAVEALGMGNLDTRVEVSDSEDELAVLGQNINRMAAQIQTLLKGQMRASEEQLATQAELVRAQTISASKQQAAKEFLQNRALELLTEVAPLQRGDLTVRANVTEDEIGTIADSYNATIESLRKLVTQVQRAAGQVAQTTDSNEDAVQELSQDALQQSQSIKTVLKQIEEMTESIQTVAQSAQAAEQAVQVAGQTLNQGDLAMNRTVEGILAIRETVADTGKKVQQLGESSQKISKVVKLIGNFAAQTNLLALKASIEAARAGDEGRGFVVLADEVRSLAQQSAKATEEIEQLVTSIQLETNEVVTAMAAGTQQVVTGTQLVEETRRSLTQIAQASDQITALVQAIAQAAVAQAQASTAVSATITDVAAISNTTSDRANQVLDSFQDLLKVAQELQTTVSQFKLS
ncbi:MAG: HAMP domain-containing protein [Aphanocapsa sp. GSE-SYN-MK-11-07L]|nr:HAMP domain-containing protein [Aphanocapsa sp. GSE-SYN-MK-11-07L]